MTLAVTTGDCNGIGLEAFFMALRANSLNKFLKNNNLILVSNTVSLIQYLNHFKFDFSIKSGNLIFNGIEIHLSECKTQSRVIFGEINSESGGLALESINKSVELYRSGEADAILTLPIAKKAIHLAGSQFPGHTELLASEYPGSKVMMILTAGNLRVALATIHEPVKKIASLLSYDLLIEKLNQFSASLKYDFGIKQPKIAVLSLNPHAGENGDIGSEEIEFIAPAIVAFEQNGNSVSGPFPADGFFGFGDFKNYDGVLAMYHDQGLVPLKLYGKGNGVNFTAGLPVVRTSPDHGTGFQIAGKGLADPKSTAEAILLAEKIYKNRKQY